MKWITLVLAILLISSSCTTVRKVAFDRDITGLTKSSPVLTDHFTGFSFYDYDEQKLIGSYNGDLLFTPGSNTKLLTMFVALRSFPDSIPGALYLEKGRSIHIDFLGDPTFLHPDFIAQPVVEKIKSYDSLLLLPGKKATPFGPGWAWDDYRYSFQPQRSYWPIYGNVVRLHSRDTAFSISPDFFLPFFETKKGTDERVRIDRNPHFNQFTVSGKIDEDAKDLAIPFVTSDELFVQLLEDTLGIPITIGAVGNSKLQTLYSQPIDSVLGRMMKTSDNFLAEQLLLMAAQEMKLESSEDFRKYVQEVWLTELDKMVWVDGSGLSRYNLISPISQVRLLKKSIDEFGWDRIQALLPSGGEGTLKGLYESETPYVFAKTGTLSNNHNLTGMLITKSGKKLLFSFMNNHYLRTTNEIKEEMEKLINQIRENY